MNNIQKLIDGLTDQLLQAEMQAKATKNEIDKGFYNGYYSACKKLRKELMLLLNEETAKDLPVCEYCDGKGWFINEEHRKWPEVQQRIDCYHCSSQ